MKATLNAQARQALDTRFRSFPQPVQLARPYRGWIKAIRQALGMTTAQLAGRLGLGQSSIVEMEQSEAKDTIRVSSLKKAAKAMNCTLVYAFIPNEPLEEMVQNRKIEIANHILDQASHSMLLENQAVDSVAARQRNLTFLISRIKESTIWTE